MIIRPNTYTHILYEFSTYEMDQDILKMTKYLCDIIRNDGFSLKYEYQKITIRHSISGDVFVLSILPTKDVNYSMILKCFIRDVLSLHEVKVFDIFPDSTEEYIKHSIHTYSAYKELVLENRIIDDSKYEIINSFII